MKLWTAQEASFYDDLMANGIAYCTMVSEVAIDNGYAYEWMAGYFGDFGEQDRKADAIPFLFLPLGLCRFPINGNAQISVHWHICFDVTH